MFPLVYTLLIMTSVRLCNRKIIASSRMSKILSDVVSYLGEGVFNRLGAIHLRVKNYLKS
jgi:hypothetical protein